MLRKNLVSVSYFYMLLAAVGVGVGVVVWPPYLVFFHQLAQDVGIFVQVAYILHLLRSG